VIPHTIVARNVNHALCDGLWWLKTSGIKSDSRNGPVLRSPGPVITHYKRPEERILWLHERDANPFFHLMESIWMLAGRNDLEFLEIFNSNMKNYAEPAGYFHGAYGKRWFLWQNQLYAIAQELTRDPNSRRAVLQMWDCSLDLGNTTAKDLPCNTHVYFEVRNQSLDMTVCNRSNDAVWGAYGANAVHFSFLQQFLAESLGLEQGVYNQFSNNFHVYTENEQVKKLLDHPICVDYYKSGMVQPCKIPLIEKGRMAEKVLMEMRNFCETPFDSEHLPYEENKFLMQVAWPMALWYTTRKATGADNVEILDAMPECDWKEAALQWRARRVENGSE